MRLAFADCVYDADSRELERSGRVRALSPKAFQLLGVLLAQRPRAVSQAELKDLLWPTSHVSRTSLARLVTEIRKAIGDSARAPRYVRNVHGFGYAFCGAAESRSEGTRRGLVMARWALVWGERRVELVEGENLIGRSADCLLQIDSPQVSRRHARLFVASGEVTLEDLGSKNGTFLDSKRVERPARLAEGARVIVGPALLILRGRGSDDSTKTGSSAR